MADHFGAEILFLFVTITFIVLLLGNFYVSYETTEFNILPDDNVQLEEVTVTEHWEDTGKNFWLLQDVMPWEFFVLFIMPLIILVAYIVIKTASGLLPNWISGG